MKFRVTVEVEVNEDLLADLVGCSFGLAPLNSVCEVEQRIVRAACHAIDDGVIKMVDPLTTEVEL